MPILSNFPGGSGSGGGGLALTAVSNIQTLTSSGKTYVKWTDPDDLVVAESTLASWSGTLLVRKAGSMPVSRRDGTIVLDSKVRNAYSTSYFCDSGLSNGTTYYYKFFPYTTTNTYTDSTDDEFELTPTAQVAGITSWNVTSMNASEEAGDGKVNITWADPSATIVSDGVTLATWAATTVVVKTGGYATSKEDSSAVFTQRVTSRNSHASSPLVVTGLTNGTTYYVSFFPETTDGGINTSTSQRTTGVANRISITATPSQSGTVTYNGNSQSPTWSNYSTTQLTLGGTTTGINAGSYTASFTPTTDYRWSDGTTTAKNVTWSISKAAGSLSLNKTSVTLDADATTATVAVTRSGDGSITAVSSDTSIATTSVSGTTVTVHSINNTTGTATVTISVAAGTNYTAPTNKTVSVAAEFLPAIGGDLDDYTWDEISQTSEAGQGDNYWDVGDRKGVLVSGTVGATAINATYYVYILGFAHKGATNTIDFGTFKTALTGGEDICLIDSSYGSSTSTATAFTMNTSYTNSGGWKSSKARYSVLGSTNTNKGNATTTTATSPVANTLMAAFPSDLRAVMKPMTIYTDNTGGGKNTASYVTTTIDYLPLLAEFEIFGSRAYANSTEQSYQEQYAYYVASNSKVKYRHSSTGSTALWWERSPCYSGKNNFCYVNTHGDASINYAHYSYGLAPAFRV